MYKFKWGDIMVIKESRGERIFNVINAIFLVILSILCLYPMLYVFFASISDPIKIMSHRGLLFFPKGFSLGSYGLVFRNKMITTGYINTLIYVTAGTAINMFMTITCAYSLSRKNVLFKNFFTFLIVFTMFFNGGLVPLYLLVKSLGMLDTRWALLIPHAMTAYNMIIMRTGFSTVPDELIEAAHMEGAGDVTILTRIIIPLSKAVISVIVLYYAVYHWNAWFDALIYVRNRAYYPLQLVLREILIAHDTSSMTTEFATPLDKEPVGITIKYSTIIVATVPVLLFYPFIQKYFTKGVMIGAIKG